jgi:hypothetical protein
MAQSVSFEAAPNKYPEALLQNIAQIVKHYLIPLF